MVLFHLEGPIPHDGEFPTEFRNVCSYLEGSIPPEGAFPLAYRSIFAPASVSHSTRPLGVEGRERRQWCRGERKKAMVNPPRYPSTGCSWEQNDLRTRSCPTRAGFRPDPRHSTAAARLAGTNGQTRSQWQAGSLKFGKGHISHLQSHHGAAKSHGYPCRDLTLGG